MTSLEISELSVTFGSTPVLNSLSLNVKSGDFAAILGPSGCGKTTLLRAIAGLVTPNSGAIRFDQKLVSVSSLVLPAHKRNVGYLPQEAGLFPHFTVGENVGFGLSAGSRKMKNSERNERIREMLDLVGLSELIDRKPHQLSGGQQTRVALARALAIKPAIVLLDEPFSNLDYALRVDVSEEVIALLKKSKTTSLMVTHDREEALVSADIIALMSHGTIVQSGTPQSIYMGPQSAEIAQSTGDIVQISAQRQPDGTVVSVLHPQPAQFDSRGELGALLIRPEEIRIHDTDKNGSYQRATVSRVKYYGHDAMVELSLPRVGPPEQTPLLARVAGPVEYAVGETVYIEHHGPIRWVSKKVTDQ